jgi:hypothetical protein
MRLTTKILTTAVALLTFVSLMMAYYPSKTFSQTAATVNVNLSSSQGLLPRNEQINNEILRFSQIGFVPEDPNLMSDLNTRLVRVFTPARVWAASQGSYSYGFYDSIIDEIESYGATPYISMDTVPLWLSVGGNEFGPPVDYDAFEDMIFDGITHFKSRYPDLVYIEAWNEPDLNVSYIDVSTYGLIYERFANAVNRVNSTLPSNVPQLKVGGPTNYRFNDVYIQGFLDIVAANNYTLDFVVWHDYQHRREPSFFESSTNQVRSWLSSRGLSAEIAISEWNIRLETGEVTDAVTSARIAAFAAVGNYYWMEAGVETPMFWVTRHSRSESQYLSQLGPTRGTVRPFYNVLEMLSMMKNTRVSATSNGFNADGYGVNAIASQDSSGVSVMLWNYQHTNANNYNVTLNLNNLPSEFTSGSIQVERYLVSENTSNYYANSGNSQLQRVENVVVSGRNSYTEVIPMNRNTVSLLVLTPSGSVPPTQPPPTPTSPPAPTSTPTLSTPTPTPPLTRNTPTPTPTGGCTINLTPTSSTVTVGTPVNLTAVLNSITFDSGVNFSSSNSSIASVSPTYDSLAPYVTTASTLTPGTVTITASAGSGCSDTATITVSATSLPTPTPTIATLPTPTTSSSCILDLSPPTATIYVGDTLNMTADLTSSAFDTGVNFSSSNVSLATILPSYDSSPPYDSTLTALSPGVVTITALAGSFACSDTSTITILDVTPTPTPTSTQVCACDIDFVPDPATSNVGAATQMTAVVTNCVNATPTNVVYTSWDPSVAVLNPGSDNLAPYTTNAECVSIGSTTLAAELFVSSSCSDTNIPMISTASIDCSGPLSTPTSTPAPTSGPATPFPTDIIPTPTPIGIQVPTSFLIAEAESEGVDIGSTFTSPFGQQFGFADLVSIVLTNGLIVAGVIVLVLTVAGGFMMVAGAGRGDTQSVGQGQKALTYALIGFAIIFTAYWLVQALEILVGFQILNPPIP